MHLTLSWQLCNCVEIHGSSFQHICAFICAKNVVILIIINDQTSLNCFNLSFNFQIKKFDPTTKRVTTIAGTGKAGFKDGKALTAQVRKWCKMYSISLYRNVKCLLRHKMLISFYRNLKCLLFRKMQMLDTVFYSSIPFHFLV